MSTTQDTHQDTLSPVGISIARFLRSHRGAGIAALFLLIMVPDQPMNASVIGRMTGYSRQTVGNALTDLSFEGIVKRDGNDWYLSSGNVPILRQLLNNLTDHLADCAESVKSSDTNDQPVATHPNHGSLNYLTDQPQNSSKVLNNLTHQPETDVSRSRSSLVVRSNSSSSSKKQTNQLDLEDDHLPVDNSNSDSFKSKTYPQEQEIQPDKYASVGLLPDHPQYTPPLDPRYSGFDRPSEGDFDDWLIDIGIADPKRHQIINTPRITFEFAKQHLHLLEMEGKPLPQNSGLFCFRLFKRPRVGKCKCSKCEFERRKSGAVQSIPEHLRDIIKR